jgi:hypothetical protein
MTRKLRWAVAISAVALLAACEDKGIGRLCDVGIPDGGMMNPNEAVINGAALECVSRVCLAAVPNAPTVPSSQYGGESPQCSATCTSDDDCSDGLTTKDATGNKALFCKTSFKCAVATTVGPFKCKQICICGDYLAPPIQTPAACSGQ